MSASHCGEDPPKHAPQTTLSLTPRKPDGLCLRKRDIFSMQGFTIIACFIIQ